MDLNTFRRILTAFADSPADIDLVKGTLVVQLREDLISARIAMRGGELTVTENDDPISATRWLIERVARLPMLADRIIAHVHAEGVFVAPQGRLLDQIEHASTDDELVVEDAASVALKCLDRRPAGTASVLYLTSDAGEGKTTLISHLARLQATKYKQRQTDWLLVPVSLGGRTFMRFDDVIIGALMNRLRYNMLFYDAFIELVKLGVVVPALDGFEEMFIEASAGDAMSAIGNLMSALQSSGSVLVAARKAFFEFKSLRTQTKLFDSLGSQSVTFSRIALCRWDKPRFLSYAKQKGVHNAEEIYEDVAANLDPSHPLLTRAVLVKRLLEVAKDPSTRESLLQRIKGDPADYFRQFIGSIISREARDKWIDKVGDPAQPLISEQEHYELLSAIAGEMWISGTEALPGDVAGFVAEMFTDSKRLDKVISRQVVERLKHHALLVPGDGEKVLFDHQEFYHFFLGESVGQMFSKNDAPTMRHALRQGILPQMAIETAALYLKHDGRSTADIVELANKVCESEPRMSLVKDNIGGILLRLIEFGGHPSVVLRNASFPLDGLKGKTFTDVDFVECYFQRSAIEHTELRNCKFVKCEFEGLDLRSYNKVEACEVKECDIHTVIPFDSDVPVFAPSAVLECMRRAGFSIDVPQLANSTQLASAVTKDSDTEIMERLLRVFLRATIVTENTVSSRLGAKSSHFFRSVLPTLLAKGIILEMPAIGGGNQRRFRLGKRLEQTLTALEECGGVFGRFVELAGS